MLENVNTKKVIKIFKFLFIVLVSIILFLLMLAIMYIFINRNHLSLQLINQIFSKRLFVDNYNLTNINEKLIFFGVYFVIIIALSVWLFYKDLKKVKKRFDKNANKWLYNQVSGEKDVKVFNKNVNSGFNKGTAWVLNVLVNKFSKKQHWLSVSHENFDRNSVVIGGTGSGKTQRVLLPNILYNINLPVNNRPNMVIIDPKKEILSFTGKRFEEQGYKIYVIDFASPVNSLNWNPLHSVYKIVEQARNEQNRDLLIDAFAKYAEAIEYIPWDSGKEAFWSEGGKQILTFLGKFMLLAKYDFDLVAQEDFNFANLQRNASMGLFAKGLEAGKAAKENQVTMLQTMEQLKGFSNDWLELYKDYMRLAGINETTLSSVLANATIPLGCFTKDKNIERLISYTSSFDLENILSSDEKFVIFIHYKDENTIYHPLVSMLIDDIYQNAIGVAKKNLVTTGREKLKNRLLFFLEEFGNLPLIPHFDNKIAINRSRNILFSLVLQDKNQLKKYNTPSNSQVDATILSNLQFMWFLNTSDENTKKMIVSKLGTKENEKYSYSTNAAGGNSSSLSYVDKPLMNEAELAKKPSDHMLVFIEGLAPLYLKTQLVYKNFSKDNYIYNQNEIKLPEKILDISSDYFEKILKAKLAEESKRKEITPEMTENMFGDTGVNLLGIEPVSENVLKEISDATKKDIESIEEVKEEEIEDIQEDIKIEIKNLQNEEVKKQNTENLEIIASIEQEIKNKKENVNKEHLMLKKLIQKRLFKTVKEIVNEIYQELSIHNEILDNAIQAKDDKDEKAIMKFQKEYIELLKKINEVKNVR
ncbi:type IV secretory system conjugative DNA transfer family protein [Mycoplasma sp. 4423]